MKKDNLTPEQAEKMTNINSDNTVLDMESLKKVSGGEKTDPDTKDDDDLYKCPNCGGMRYLPDTAAHIRYCRDCYYSPPLPGYH